MAEQLICKKLDKEIDCSKSEMEQKTKLLKEQSRNIEWIQALNWAEEKLNEALKEIEKVKGENDPKKPPDTAIEAK